LYKYVQTRVNLKGRSTLKDMVAHWLRHNNTVYLLIYLTYNSGFKEIIQPRT